MVCGSFAPAGHGAYAGSSIVPPGVWAPTDQGINAVCTWQAASGNGWTPWTEQAKLPVPCLAIPERHASQLDVDTPPRSPSSASSVASAATAASAPEARCAPNAARAAKRLRCRERRRLFKEAARSAAAGERATADLAQSFEAHAAAVAAEVRLVVKKTFFEVDSEDSASSDGGDIELPPALFETTREVDEWRRGYRRFRLGHHQGARGELAAV